MKTFDALVSKKCAINSGTYLGQTLCEITGMIKRATDLVIPDDVLEKVTYIYFENPMLTIINNTNRCGITISIELIPVGGIHNKKGGFYDEEYYQVTLTWKREHKFLNIQEESKDVRVTLENMLKCLNLEFLI